MTIETVKKLSSLALPMAGTQFINIASGFLCMVMLAHLGHEVLAASALISSIQISMMVTGMSILFSISVLVGHAYGAKNYVGIGNFVQQGWTLGLIISIPIMIFFWHIHTILIFFGQSKEITKIVQDYFHAYIWAVIPVMLAVCNQQFGYGIRQQKLMILTSMMSVIILLITAYTFIFGKFGMPQLGVQGLAYAMALQSLFFFLFTNLCFYIRENFKPFELFQYRVHQNWNYFSKMLKLGWPMSLQMGGEMLSFVFISLMVGWLGAKALAAYQVVNQYCFLALIPLFALSQASGILIGHAKGAEQFQEIKKLGNASICLILLITIIVGGIFLLIPKHLASFYLDVNNPQNVETVHLIVLIFTIAAISQIFDGIRNILIGILRGLFDTKFSMVMNLVIIWMIGIPLSYLFGFVFHRGVMGIALGSTIGMLIGAFIMMYRWHYLSRSY